MQFFLLGDLRTDDPTYAAYGHSIKPEHIGDAPRCPLCNQYVGMLAWLPPYNAEIVVHGRKLGDIIECSGNDLLVSAHFRDAWLTEGFRGIDVFSPLERLRIRPARLGRKPVTYFHVEPRLFGTQIDLARSLIEYDRPITCSKCGSGGIDSVRGFAIDEKSWTGEDLFFPWGMSGRLIVTDRVRQMRDKYGLTNMNLVPVEEVLIDPYRRWTPVDHSPDDPDEELIPPDSSSTN